MNPCHLLGSLFAEVKDTSPDAWDDEMDESERRSAPRALLPLVEDTSP